MVLNPFFTILTAALNSGASLETTLRSVEKQTLKSLEHLVIDGGSRDQTVKILQEYQGKYNLRWISEPDSGIASALNKGVRNATGKYLLVLQADDRFWDPEVLARVHRLLREESADIHSFPVLLDDQSRGMVPYRPLKILWWHHFKTIFPHQGAFVHRRVFERVGGFREELRIAFDYDFFYRALQAGASVRFGESPVAIMGGGGISSARGFLTHRLKEEAYVQNLNEKNQLWRAIQLLFRAIYVPYKMSIS